jgi:glutamate--cysteine ligase
MRHFVTVEDLHGHFRNSFQRLSERVIGVEYELLGVLTESGRALPYDGAEPCMVEVLDGLCRKYGWHPVGGEPMLELRREGTRVTLEPGSQLELSLRPHRGIEGIRTELAEWLAELRDVARPLGACFVPLGTQPVSTPDDIEIIPKERYRIMNAYLPTRGSLARWMMRGTAGMQVNLDMETAEDAVRALRLALCTGSVLTALFANSSISEGGPNGWHSRRARIWLEVDDDRCGLPERLVSPDVTPEDYVEWALDAGMFFISREDRLIDMTGITFRQFVTEGARGQRASLADWETHLTTLFPESRLKHYLELRCADSNAPTLALGFAALAEGLFYGGPGILDGLERLVGAWSYGERSRFHEDCARHGLGAIAPSGKTAEELAVEVVALAGRGLDEVAPHDRAFLTPVEELARAGRSPAGEALERWRSDWRGSPAEMARSRTISC